MTIQIRMMTLGLAATNCYIVGDTEAQEALVIDPVDDAQAIQRTASAAGWEIKLILATHAHFDHVLASKELKALTGAPFWIHQECVPYLKALPQQGMMFVGHPFPDAAEPDRLLTSDRETLSLGPVALQTIYTPGHAPGHLSLYMAAQKIVFCGDALFQGSIGRTDLPGGDLDLLMHSIFDQLLPLGDDVIALPGHGGRTTLGDERRTNPFLIEWMERQK